MYRRATALPGSIALGLAGLLTWVVGPARAQEAVPRPAAYHINPPDILRLTLQGDCPPQARASVEGEHLVRPDGTISLGTFGFVRVADCTAEQSRAAIEKHLALYVAGVEVRVEVVAYNSAKVYVIVDGKGSGEQVHAFPCTAALTVRQVLQQPGRELRIPAGARVWLARPGGRGEVLAVHWQAVAQDAAHPSNHRLQAGDRVYVQPGKAQGPTAGAAGDERYVGELLGILEQTTSADTYLLTLTLLAKAQADPRQAVPAAIRSAERLGIFARHLHQGEANEEARLARGVFGLIEELAGRRTDPAGAAAPRALQPLEGAAGRTER